MFTVEYLDDGVRTWSLTADGAECELDETYRPTLYASASSAVDALADRAAALPYVTTTSVERHRTAFRDDPEPVVRLDVERIDDVRRAATRIRRWGDPGEYRLYNVDFSREFRYCLETGTAPVPERDPTTLELAVSPVALDNDDLSTVRIDGDVHSGPVPEILDAIQTRVDAVDPDVLVVSAGDLVPTLYEVAADHDRELQLGRRPGWQQLAGESTYTSYGRVGHSPARYDVPGRALVDRSNTFFYTETNLEGCLDLVRRSWKPLQELSWASIGNVLTAIQIREALARDVLVPWKSWRHEQFKTARQLQDADRGGFTFSPSVGVHETVHELDFSSLYPNIICEYNVSPDKIRCDCHADREDVPGLGYSVCDERGYLPDVLQPLVDDRDAIKDEIAAATDPERIRELEGRSSAIKWILVSCFGYQGFSNAKFGRIECHEAINAYAREILLDAKEALEAAGWRVVHGIVDSIWVTPRPDATQRPLPAVAAEITDDVGIRLEYENEYDWIAFVPRRDSDAGALTKYFGAVADAEAYKYRGIECRQRSTPAYVADVQRDLVDCFDAHRSPEAVCDRLARELARLRAGEVDPERLVIDKRTSKAAGAYGQYTHTVAALERAADAGRDVHPGEHVRYVVVDDEKSSRDRVTLAAESPTDYDPAFYADLLVRAAESVLSPVGWRRADVREYLAETTEATLARFG
ncbi:type B DNA-directed DNA polymerase [Halorientalis brevis]|uniref:DNA-directed DNA polymerase n=1 Tax=Halorientalis brevis TaxID=1126241 RepID=A0ABD6CGS7_9EURY|nr:type B DNA-directed DNA polymerase [Halorientalis brevis]